MDLFFILHPSQKTRAVFYKSREGSEHYTAHRFRLHAYAYMYFFWPHHVANGILVVHPGIEPTPPALEAKS